MQLHLVDNHGSTLTVDVDNEVEAQKLFDRVIIEDPWIAATLVQNHKYVTSFLRITQEEESHPLVSSSMIEHAIDVRGECRADWQYHEREPEWWIPGLCHEVSEWLEEEYGFARTSGTIMARDCVTPICLHYWNVLPDLSILDMTADQLMEGSDYRIIPKGHPDWYRYQPEFDDYEDTLDLLGKGIYSDELIEFIVETGRRLERRQPARISNDYLHALPASEKIKSKLEPIVTEFPQACLPKVQKEESLKRHRDEDGPGQAF